MRGRKKASRLGALVYYVARGLILAVRFLPWKLAKVVAIAASQIIYLLDGRHRRLAREAVSSSFPRMSVAEHRAIVRGCYRHLGLAVVEFARLATMRREEVRRLWVMSDDQVRTMAELNAERPAPIYVTGHVGLWELSGLGYTAHGLKLNSIARPLDDPRTNELIDSVRERFGQRILAKRGALVAALHGLREGTPVAMLLDQDARKHGVFVPLFGRLASTLPTAAEIALRTGSAIVCVSGWRDEAAGVHRLRLGKIIRSGKWSGSRGAQYQEEVRRITAEYTLNIEEAVREHPEQWLWLHRRWKTRPPEEQPGGAEASASG
jgi:KDO2-lipid IV(A) lauroyltransferase